MMTDREQRAAEMRRLADDCARHDYGDARIIEALRGWAMVLAPDDETWFAIGQAILGTFNTTSADEALARAALSALIARAEVPR